MTNDPTGGPPLRLPLAKCADSGWLRRLVTYVIPYTALDIREYLDQTGKSPFAAWFEGLNPYAAAKVTTALARVAHGNLSNVKGVGGGVSEYKIDFGPGYRIYFGRDGEHLVILVGGGTKKRQHLDVATAIARWRDYKTRKQEETAWLSHVISRRRL